MIESDFVARFLFGELDIRGAFVRLGDAWRSMQARRNYAATVRDLLGEMTATAVLIASNLKQPDRLSFQLKGHGPIGFLVYDCPEARNKVGEMLRALGRAEVESILKEQGEVLVHDDICNHTYRFGAADLDEIFPPQEPQPRTLH